MQFSNLLVVLATTASIAQASNTYEHDSNFDLLTRDYDMDFSLNDQLFARDIDTLVDKYLLARDIDEMIETHLAKRGTKGSKIANKVVDTVRPNPPSYDQSMRRNSERLPAYRGPAVTNNVNVPLWADRNDGKPDYPSMGPSGGSHGSRRHSV